MKKIVLCVALLAVSGILVAAYFGKPVASGDPFASGDNITAGDTSIAGDCRGAAFSLSTTSQSQTECRKYCETNDACYIAPVVDETTDSRKENRYRCWCRKRR